MMLIQAESKTRSTDRIKYLTARACARAAYGVHRLMPVMHDGAIIAWCGWSWKNMAAYVFHHKPWMRTWIDKHGLLCGWTSVDDLINEATNNGKMRQLFWFKCNGDFGLDLDWTHWFNVGYFPAPGLFNGTAYTAKQHSDADQGALLHGGNVSTDTKHIVGTHARVMETASTPQVIVIYDMVLSYDQSTVNIASQNFVNTLTAQRYIGGSDPGLQIMGAFSTSHANNTDYTNLKYTSIGGTAGRVVPGRTLTQLFSNNAATTTVAGNAGQTCFAYKNTTNANILGLLMAPLVNGDSGVKQLDSVQMAATTTDAHNYILGFPLAWIPLHHGGDFCYAQDLVKQIASVPRILDGACLTLALFTNVSFGGMHGGINVAWG